MQNKEHSLCFTGHRSEKLPKTEKEMEQLRNSLLREIDKAMENGDRKSTRLNSSH